VFLNGKRVVPEIPLRALFFGDGLFETFRYRFRVPVLIDKHYSRMERGAEMLGIPLIQREKFTAMVEKAVTSSEIRDAYVKVCLLSRGRLDYYDSATEGDIAIIVKAYESRKEVIKVCISEFRRYSDSPVRSLKSLNYLENIIARRAAQKGGYDEAVFLNERREIAEGTASNIFWVDGDTLYTPSIDCGILPGTTRELLLNSANQVGLRVEEGRYSPECVNGSRFAFLTSSLTGSTLLSHFNHSIFSPGDELYESIKRLLFTGLGWV